MKPNHLDVRIDKDIDINKAISRTVIPRLMGDRAIMQEKNNVVINEFRVSKVMEYSYNKRFSSLGFKILRAVYTIL